jgi:hypothetical protein
MMDSAQPGRLVENQNGQRGWKVPEQHPLSGHVLRAGDKAVSTVGWNADKDSKKRRLPVTCIECARARRRERYTVTCS